MYEISFNYPKTLRLSLSDNGKNYRQIGLILTDSGKHLGQMGLPANYTRIQTG